ncbi:protoheme IX farnesyltransferase [Candidatus Saccharibacteria bacterium]|nr:protoheme IX farnesyltransferase [Candidatus Saccharibacteria bacterium]
MKLGTYFSLIKPERTITNTITAVAGYLFASRWEIDLLEFTSLITGLTLIIASANVLNNYLDRGLDSKMARTKNRALPSGRVSASGAIAYAVALGLAGFGILAYTNWLTLAIIAMAYFSYVVVYGFAKRHTVHGTLIGTIPGSASLVAGYTAVTGRLDSAALILFVIMLAWQMVHFYAIATYRLRDYATAKIPVMPVKRGVELTKRYMLAYLIIFIFAANLLTWEDYTGYIYLSAVGLLGLLWLRVVLRGFHVKNNEQWAREVFKFSLVVLLVMSVSLAVGPILP